MKRGCSYDTYFTHVKTAYSTGGWWYLLGEDALVVIGGMVWNTFWFPGVWYHSIRSPLSSLLWPTVYYDQEITGCVWIVTSKMNQGFEQGPNVAWSAFLCFRENFYSGFTRQPNASMTRQSCCCYGLWHLCTKILWHIRVLLYPGLLWNLSPMPSIYHYNIHSKSPKLNLTFSIATIFP